MWKLLVTLQHKCMISWHCNSVLNSLLHFIQYTCDQCDAHVQSVCVMSYSTLMVRRAT